MGIVAPHRLRQRCSERGYMSLLRSLAGGTAPVAINMAVLKELFAWPLPLRCVNDARIPGKESLATLKSKVGLGAEVL
jgi:hypothetical protein